MSSMTDGLLAQSAHGGFFTYPYAQQFKDVL
jgi:hypothetical protein